MSTVAAIRNGRILPDGAWAIGVSGAQVGAREGHGRSGGIGMSDVRGAADALRIQIQRWFRQRRTSDFGTKHASGFRRLHPLPVRVMHWVNAIAMLIMITSGWGIYNDYVIIGGLHFSKSLRLGDWAAESLLWHFAGMWFLAINGLAYLLYGAVTGRFRERLLPIKMSDVLKTIDETLHFKIAHSDITHYNAVQKLLYLVVIAAGMSQVVTGIAIWKPIQFSWLVSLFGGFQGARLVHFLGMAVIVGFLVVHVALSLLVPSTLWAMLTGGPRVTGPTARAEAET